MYIKDDIMENFIKREAIENNIQKLKMNVKEEELTLEEIKEVFLNSSYLYKTKNTEKFSDIENEA